MYPNVCISTNSQTPFAGRPTSIGHLKILIQTSFPMNQQLLCIISIYTTHGANREFLFWSLLRYRQTCREWVALKCSHSSLSVTVSVRGSLRVIYWSKVLLPDSIPVLLTQLIFFCAALWLCCFAWFLPSIPLTSFNSFTGFHPSSKYVSAFFPPLLRCQSLQLCHSVCVCVPASHYWFDLVAWRCVLKPLRAGSFGSGVCVGLIPLTIQSRVTLP